MINDMNLISVSLWALITIFILAQISGRILKIKSDRYYSYFHFTAGFFTALFFWGLFKNYILALIFTFIVGILWEVGEWFLWRFFLKSNQFKPKPKDTINDLILDVAGGITALLLLSKFLFP